MLGRTSLFKEATLPGDTHRQHGVEHPRIHRRRGLHVEVKRGSFQRDAFLLNRHRRVAIVAERM